MHRLLVSFHIRACTTTCVHNEKLHVIFTHAHTLNVQYIMSYLQTWYL